MRFIFDECCHRLFATELREAGHDIRYVADSDSGATDEAIANLALEENRIVVTADYDFGELVVRHHRLMPGVILLAPSARPIGERVSRLVLAVSNLGARLEGTLTIIEDERLRFRPLQ